VAKLVVLMAFDRNEDGELVPAFEPRQYDDEARARREAKAMAESHDGVIAWSREADPALGEYGEPAELFHSGEIPDME
jgi:hypothetical protein